MNLFQEDNPDTAKAKPATGPTSGIDASADFDPARIPLPHEPGSAVAAPADAQKPVGDSNPEGSGSSPRDMG